MSIVENYRGQFRIYLLDQDIGRSELVAEQFRNLGYKFATFNEPQVLRQGMENNMPHMVILFYQPLDIKFRKTISDIRKLSAEVEIVVLGSGDFWPGIKNLLNNGLANDFWGWPMASRECLRLRVDHFIERTIYKYVAEQKTEETSQIVKAIDELKEMEFIGPGQTSGQGSRFDFYQLPEDIKSEARLIEDLVGNLKINYQECEFAYLKYYEPKEQVLVYKTSFSTDGHCRGQFFSKPTDELQEEKKNDYDKLHTTIEELFLTKDYKLFPVEFSDKTYGFMIAFHLQDDQVETLEKTTRYVSLTLRNLDLEKVGTSGEVPEVFGRGVEKRTFFETIAKEISRARRIETPVSLLLAHVVYPGDQDEAMREIRKAINENIRIYDYYAQLSENEIAIVLPHTEYENGAIKAERLRRLILGLSIKSQNSPVRLCFGVSEFPRLSQDSDELLESAKLACDQVLSSGQNKVCLYTQADDFEPEFQV